MNDRSAALVQEDESCSLELYEDSLGVPTIGWGTNIKEISQEEADWLFQHRFQAARKAAQSLPFYSELNEPRRAVIENMIYNMGLPRFMTFKQFQAALLRGDWLEAKKQMLYNSAGDDLSPWAKQVGSRATKLAHMIETGDWADV